MISAAGSECLACPSCGAECELIDQFCERCGGVLASARAAARMRLEIDRAGLAAVSDVGHVHRTNEDAVCVDEFDGGFVAVVADGVSSSSRADIAAIVAVRSVVEFARTHDGDAAGVVSAAIVSAARAVDALSRAVDHHDAPPSCTIVAAVRRGPETVVGWAGDSRAYWLDSAGAHLLTTDHSWVQEQMDAGCSPVDAMADSRAHAITRWLGADGDGEFSSVVLAASGRGRLVLCSDGLWNMLDDEAIGEVAAAAGAVSALDAARVLVDAALARGGLDNVTVAIVDHPGSSEEGPDESVRS
jgi:PPM family protein phosphatase